MLHKPVDAFLSSLAEDAGKRSAAVILSGTGNDGSQGARKVREAGGTVVAQSIETAEFAAMPQSIVQSGTAHAALAPSQIPGYLREEYGKTKEVASESPHTLERIIKLIRTLTDHDFSEYKVEGVRRRIHRRLRIIGLNSLEEYEPYIQANPSEAENLTSELLIGVTSFFRDNEAWESFRKNLVQSLLQTDHTGSPIRIWIPACATGEEAYTAAIILFEEIEKSQKKRDFLIFASDINDQALETARYGTYQERIRDQVPEEHLAGFFDYDSETGTYRVQKRIRDSIVFAHHNLLSDPPFSHMDAIICRNLLIYVEPPAQERILRIFHFALNREGFLFLGSAESVDGKINTQFLPVDKRWRIYSRTGGRGSYADFDLRRVGKTRVATNKPVDDPAAQVSLGEIARNAVLDRYVPATIVVTEDRAPCYFAGPINEYIRVTAGAPPRDITQMVLPGLSSHIAEGLAQTFETGEVFRTTVEIAPKKDRGNVIVTIESILAAGHNRMALVVLQPEKEVGNRRFPEAGDDHSKVVRLQHELDLRRRELERSLSEHRALNEELQSSNEELQISNEELETSREELQSLNEELVSANTQLQEKIQEVQSTNNDLRNFLSGSDVPMLFLDHELKIRRFSPAVSRLLNLRTVDIGRSISDFSERLIGVALEPDIHSVTDTGSSRDRETATDKGATYLRRIAPYRVDSGKIEGVVITWTDISERKKFEMELLEARTAAELRAREAQEGRQILDALLDHIPEGILIYAKDSGPARISRVLREWAGRSLPEQLPLSRTSIEQLGLFRLEGGSPAEAAELPLSRVIENGETIRDEMWLQIGTDGSQRILSTVAGPIYDSEGQTLGGIVSWRDVTDQRRMEEELRWSEERHRRLFTNSLSAVAFHEIILDEHGKALDYRFLDVNDRFEEFTGLRRADVVGKTAREVIPDLAEEPAGWIARYAVVALNGTPTRFREFAQGLNRWYLVSAFSAGRGFFYAVFDDITDQVHAEKRIAESEALFRSTFDNAAVGMAHVAPDGTWLRVNNRLCSMVGYSREELVSRAFQDITHPDDLQGDQALVEQVLSGRLETYNLEKRYIRKDGTSVWINLTVSIQRNSEGEPLYFISVIEDITERKAAALERDRLLVESTMQREFLESLMAAAPVGVAVVHMPDYRYELANDYYSLIPGVPGFEMIGRTVEEAFPDYVAQGGLAILDEVYTTGETKRISELETYVGLGEERRQSFWNVAFVKVPSATHGDSAVMIVAAEITDQVQFRHSLQETAARDEAILSTMADGVVMTDPEGSVIYHNAASLAIHGYNSLNDAIRTKEGIRDEWTCMEPDGTPLAYDAWPVARVIRGESFQGYEVRVRRNDTGVEYVGSFSGAPVRDENGRIITTLLTLRDITAKKRLELALRRSEERFRAVVESYPYSVILYDSQGYVQYMNAHAREFGGVRETVVAGKTNEELFSDAVSPEYTSVLHEAVDTRRPQTQELQIRLGEADKTVILDVVPLLDNEGQVEEVLAVSTDITERKRMEQDIIRRSEALARANKELESFTYTASHDLRGPLRSIDGYSMILLEDHKDEFSESAHKYLSRIRMSAGRMGEIMDDLLKLSRVSRWDMHRVPVDLGQVAEDIMAELGSRDPARTVSFRLNGENFETTADPGLIRTVLENLLGNAWKFTDMAVEPSITLNVVAQEGEKVFSVRDNGAGFDPRYVDRLFKPFQRLHAPEEFPGSGIGLSLVERIVTRHGGRVWARSGIGEGAEFFFTLGKDEGR